MKAAICALAVLLASLSGTAGAAPASATTVDATGCGSLAADPVPVTKVLTIVMENTDRDQVVGSAQAPNMNALIRACGLAADYHGIQFPSLPNYLALTSGQIPPAIAGDGVKGRDCTPSATCQSTDPSIFTQIGATAGGSSPLSWRTYAQDMPENCTRDNAGRYVPRHNPAVYYAGDAAACARFDVPSGSPASGALASDLAGGTLPSYSLFIPNLCNDGHNSCNGVPRVAAEDATIGDWMPAILASPDYRSGHLLVVITADTSQSPANGNLLTTILVNPDIPAGTTATDRFDHYSLLRLDEELLGLPPLANAAAAADMAPAFNLPIS